MSEETNKPSVGQPSEVPADGEVSQVQATVSGAANENLETAATAAERKKAKSAMRLKMAALGGALFGMVFGAVVEMFVQGAMESTGYFGPTLDSVLEEQQTNFSAIQAKLAELDAASDTGERVRIQSELEALLAKEEEFASALQAELISNQQQIEELRAEAMEAQGASGGADVWLRVGESISVGSRQNVFSVIKVDPYRRARVNITGEQTMLNVGDYVEAPADDGNWKVFYKQSQRGDDRKQFGFDVVAPP